MISGIERRHHWRYRWHGSRISVLIPMIVAACATSPSGGPPDTPADGARHRAALATVLVTNGTREPLTIAFRSATPPVLEVVIGRVPAGASAPMAPIPAGEPIIMIARMADGTELILAPRSFALDAEWKWEIPQDATFAAPAK